MYAFALAHRQLHGRLVLLKLGQVEGLSSHELLGAADAQIFEDTIRSAGGCLGNEGGAPWAGDKATRRLSEVTTSTLPHGPKVLEGLNKLLLNVAHAVLVQKHLSHVGLHTAIIAYKEAGGIRALHGPGVAACGSERKDVVHWVSFVGTLWRNVCVWGERFH